jgi:hypothetical protein
VCFIYGVPKHGAVNEYPGGQKLSVRQRYTAQEQEHRDNFTYRLDPVLRIILLIIIVSSKGNGKGKSHPRTGMKAQRRSRCIVPLFL